MPATENVWRNLRTMHVVFAVSSLAMLATTIWMMAADYDDEWRVIQRTNFKLTSEQLQAKEQAIEDDKFNREDAALAKRAADEKQKLKVEPQRSELHRLEKKLAGIESQFTRATQKVREERAKRDKFRADFDLKVRDEAPPDVLKEYQQQFNAQQKLVDDLELSLQTTQAELDAARAEVAAVTKPRDDADAALKKHRTGVARLEKAKETIDPNPWSLSGVKRHLMELPIVEGFNGPVKLNQLWLPELRINYGGMGNADRFDRCITCHMNIDKVETGNVAAFPHDPHGLPADKTHGGESQASVAQTGLPPGQSYPAGSTAAHPVNPHGYKHPYSTHPNPDLYLTDKSPHPMQKFGCTICHEGQGSGTSFHNASHSPNTPAAGEHWHEKYKWFHNHFWEFPMNPKRLAESGCIKCHHNVVELGVNPKFGASAPKAYAGYELIRKYGCFGCHEINGYNAGKAIGPDMRLEPGSEDEAARIASDPTAVAGTMRKVGPGLRHFAFKTTRDWAERWIENPQRFRPETRMPRFFGLTNQHDATAVKFQPVEIAGITEYLFSKSEPIKLDRWDKDYKPDAENGKKLFSERGCMACHQHDDFKPKADDTAPALLADFGPNLTNVHAKIKPGADGAAWLYTWIRDPQRHSPRSRMPNTFLTVEGTGDKKVDPAADIVAYLLKGGSSRQPTLKVDPVAVDEMIRMYLAKLLSKQEIDHMLGDGTTQGSRIYPRQASEVKGDEIELTGGPISPDMKLRYLGRRSISRYGCYGCHDIAGFEKARPIGTALQDWGRKDSSKLALEHIEEYLVHHGEPDGSSTKERIEHIVKAGVQGEHRSPQQADRDDSAAFFYEQLMGHGRAGFLWQKLRSPRSYDYKKISTKGYDERLRMPKFPFDELQIEAIATFVLGLVAEPPSEKYLYRPQGAAKSRIEGEKLLNKYNCVGCHMVELPEIRYGIKPGDLTATELQPAEYDEGRKLLLKLKPPRDARTQQKLKDGEQVIGFHGLLFKAPEKDDAPEDREYYYDLWETIKIDDGKVILPGTRITVPALKQVSVTPARGGAFAEWLVDAKMKDNPENNRFLSWQMSPPPLYQEGMKVQTPWLYNFLRNPGKIRHTTVLRMPRFNMSSEEAAALADYFSAVDGSPYPYQAISQREPDYLDAKLAKNPNYLPESWRLLNAPLCIKCHSVGGREYQSNDPKKDIRGPNLDAVPERLRPDWTMLWLFKPSWITPYTSMPQPLTKNQTQFPELFHGDGLTQTVALRDALMNYYRLLEKEGKVAGEVTSAPPAKAAGEGGQ